MTSDEAGEIAASQGCEHPARLGVERDSRKWLSTGQELLEGVDVLGAGVLGVEVLLDEEVDELVELEEELEEPVFVFLSRESLR
jgi:hypothetical protein